LPPKTPHGLPWTRTQFSEVRKWLILLGLWTLCISSIEKKSNFSETGSVSCSGEKVMHTYWVGSTSEPDEQHF
jgi:hypothetical protein